MKATILLNMSVLSLNSFLYNLNILQLCKITDSKLQITMTDTISKDVMFTTSDSDAFRIDRKQRCNTGTRIDCACSYFTRSGHFFSFPSGRSSCFSKVPKEVIRFGVLWNLPKAVLALKEFTLYHALKNAFQEMLFLGKNGTTVTKNKHLKILISLLRKGVRSFSLVRKKYLLDACTYSLIWLSQQPCIQKGHLWSLLVRKHTERDHNLLKITQQISVLK